MLRSTHDLARSIVNKNRNKIVMVAVTENREMINLIDFTYEL